MPPATGNSFPMCIASSLNRTASRPHKFETSAHFRLHRSHALVVSGGFPSERDRLSLRCPIGVTLWRCSIWSNPLAPPLRAPKAVKLADSNFTHHEPRIMSTLNSIMSELRWQKRQRFRQRQRMVNRRQRKVNQISSTADFAQIEPSSLDVGSGVLHAALASLWRRKPLVGAIVATAVALGIIAVLVIPRSYTAVAYIRGGFAASDALAKDEDSSSASPMSVDLVRMIETQSRLLQSQDLARRVVRQLGLEQLRPEVSESQWLPDKFYGSAANHSRRPD